MTDDALVLLRLDAVGRAADAQSAGQAQRPVGRARRAARRGRRRGRSPIRTCGSSSSPGAGRAFSAGYDLTEEAEGGIGGPVGWRKLLAVDVAATLRILDSPKPVIAQIHGYALAGGLELAMACDLVVAAEGTKLGEPEIRYGSAPVTLLMPYLIGQKKTRELLLTGDLIDAVEAERIGLDQPGRAGRPAGGRGGRPGRPTGTDAARGDGPDQGDAQPGDGRGRVPARRRGRPGPRRDHQRRRHARAARVGRHRQARRPEGGPGLARPALRRAARREWPRGTSRPRDPRADAQDHRPSASAHRLPRSVAAASHQASHSGGTKVPPLGSPCVR